MTDPAFFAGPRPAVRIERRYDHPVERVWQAVTTSENLAAWFPSEVDLELRPGGAIRFGSFDGEAARGQVLEVETGRRLVFTWGNDRLTLELRPDGDGTIFSLRHEFDDRYGAASFATGWEQCLTGLRDLLAGRQPSAEGKGIDRHEELVTRFGLDQPEVSHTATGWQARFERQLTCPAQLAWDLFFGTDPQTGEVRRAPATGEEFRPYAAPEVVLGVVTEVDPPHSFAFDVAPGEPGDHLRLQLGDGTGHGARLVLTVTGTAEDELGAAVDQWGGGAIAYVAREAARLGSASLLA